MQDALDLILSALASPTRRAMLDRLRQGEALAGELGRPFALSQPTISAHLKILETAGLVTRGRQSNQRPVRLRADALASVDGWIGPYRQLWEHRLDQWEAVAQDLQSRETQNDHADD
jgi:DNA-binding transcriptional ArsR family regulator